MKSRFLAVIWPLLAKLSAAAGLAPIDHHEFFPHTHHFCEDLTLHPYQSLQTVHAMNHRGAIQQQLWNRYAAIRQSVGIGPGWPPDPRLSWGGIRYETDGATLEVLTMSDATRHYGFPISIMEKVRLRYDSYAHNKLRILSTPNPFLSEGIRREILHGHFGEILLHWNLDAIRFVSAGTGSSVTIFAMQAIGPVKQFYAMTSNNRQPMGHPMQLTHLEVAHLIERMMPDLRIIP